LSSSKNSVIPNKYTLEQNYPNPFNPTTILLYDLPEASFVDLTIYDMLGNVVNNLVNENQNSGSKSVQWDAKNNQGEPVSAGVYLYKIQAGAFSQTKKMILLK
ncbi:MAG: T9SS type A sorting domain-containing protein, partial [Candidatus Marinimicrobia bacterium]|nr:T9SS type A sorting domain-containing protein [Candidatus Neomarinimicrobiota bacterium]